MKHIRTCYGSYFVQSVPITPELLVMKEKSAFSEMDRRAERILRRKVSAPAGVTPRFYIQFHYALGNSSPTSAEAVAALLNP